MSYNLRRPFDDSPPKPTSSCGCSCPTCRTAHAGEDWLLQPRGIAEGVRRRFDGSLAELSIRMSKRYRDESIAEICRRIDRGER